MKYFKASLLWLATAQVAEGRERKGWPGMYAVVSAHNLPFGAADALSWLGPSLSDAFAC